MKEGGISCQYFVFFLLKTGWFGDCRFIPSLLSYLTPLELAARYYYLTGLSRLYFSSFMRLEFVPE
jgi:hypothetical protein